MNANKKVYRAARHLFRLCVVDGRLDEERARRVARRVAASRRRGALRMLSAFQRLVRLDRGRHTALVEMATPLPPPFLDTVRAELTQIYGAGLQTSFEHNPDLIAGLRIRVGSDVYDGSVRGRLAALEGRF